MSSSPPAAKKIKADFAELETEEERDTDSETQKALEEIDACQNQIDELSEKASDDILKVEQKYNKLRKPFFEKRNLIIKRIPSFWFLAISNHQVLGKVLDEEEGDCLQYLFQLEVEEFDDIKMGYKISFHFESNPYFENSILTKEFHTGNQEPYSKSTPIEWREGRDLGKLMREKNNKERKINVDSTTFFTWFEDHCDPAVDEIAEIIKDDLWPNPLQYFLASPLDDDTNGASSIQDYEEDSDEDGDDAVVILEEEEFANNDEDDDDDEEKEDENEKNDENVEEGIDVENPAKEQEGVEEGDKAKITGEPADD